MCNTKRLTSPQKAAVRLAKQYEINKRKYGKVISIVTQEEVEETPVKPTKEEFKQRERAKQNMSRKEYEAELKAALAERQQIEKDIFTNEEQFTQVMGDNRACKLIYEKMIIQDEHTHCPRCNQYAKIWRIKKREFRYTCSKCKRQFSLFTSTIFWKSRIKFSSWMRLFLQEVKTVGGALYSELPFTASASLKTVRRMLNKIRGEAFTQQAWGQFTGTNPVAKDTMELNANNAWRKDQDKMTREDHKANALDIATFQQQNGFARAEYVPNLKKTTMEALILKLVAKTCPFFTDEHLSYIGARKLGYNHKTIKHKDNDYARYEYELINNELVKVQTITTNWVERLHGIIRKCLKRHGLAFTTELLNLLLNKIIFDINLRGYTLCEKMMFGLRNTIKNRHQVVATNNVVSIADHLKYAESILKIAA